MKYSKILLFCLVFLPGLLVAQTDFREGYIIKLSGDTTYGNIDYRGDFLMSSVCRFQNNEQSITEYFPSDIIAFRFMDSKYYVSREVNDKKVFLEYLIKGEINIYYNRDDNGDHYYLDKENVRLTEITYENDIKYIEEKQFKVESTEHIGILKYYMKDAPDLKDRISSIDKPSHRSLIKIAEDYHNVVCSGEQCIIYEKKTPLVKMNLEVVSGVVNFKDLDDKFHFQNGLLGHFWLPRTNEKIYFKTGILISTFETENEEKYRNIKVPTHIGYLAPKTFRVRPSISIGLLSPSYSGGVVFRINENINIGVQSWVNFNYEKVLWIPSELFSYSVLGNIYMEF